MHCWGLNTSGQATDQVGPYTAIAAGLQHTCAITATKTVDCWGSNTSGQAADQLVGTYTAVAIALPEMITFGGANKVIFTTAPTLTNNIITKVGIGGADFATYNATNGIVAFTGYNTSNNLNTAATTGIENDRPVRQNQPIVINTSCTSDTNAPRP